MGLKEYRAKRDFTRTAEPAGAKTPGDAKGKRLSFVIQKHAARRLHYDFRLEMEGVLKSWAVPKGLPLRKGEKHLAVHVEDHPFDYGAFEGTIPQGNYGAGTVMVWDRGSYEVVSDDPLHALRAGKIHFILEGEKLKGEWALIRLRPRDGEDKENWLIFKSGQDASPIPRKIEDRSVLSDRTMEEITASPGAYWQSNRSIEDNTRNRKHSEPTNRVRTQQTGAAETSVPLSKRSSARMKLTGKVRLPKSRTAGARDNGASEMLSELKDLPKAKPAFVAPMKCLLVEKLPKGAQWLYEIKFDGYRAEAIKEGRKVSLISRNGKDLTGKYPQVVEALRALPVEKAVLDGEVVAVDAEGKSSFQLLQSYDDGDRAKPPLSYYVFDVMNLDGRSLRELPLHRRKEILEPIVRSLRGTILFSGAIAAEPERLTREMKAHGLEGLIAKNQNSQYEAGQRSGAWVKFKWSNEQEFVIGGYTEPQGTRPYFGAILVGYFDKGRLMFASKVGTGFDTKLLESLFKKFRTLRRDDCPFANLPEKREGRWSQGITPAKMKSCAWVEPRLVAQIRFTEWTRDGHLRHPVFLGLREDKAAKEVVREGPTSP